MIFLVVLLLSVLLKLNLSYDTVKDYLSNLLVVSTMVFTLMAIWIAYLYPEALDKIKDEEDKVENVDFSEAQAKLRRLEFIVASVFKSAIVAIIVMGIFLFKAIFENVTYLQQVIPYIHTLAPSVLISTFILQFEAVYSVVQANMIFINELHGRKERKEQDEDI